MEKPIINCHAHIFTVKDVPPLIAKSIIPAPLHLLARTAWLVGLIKLWSDIMSWLNSKAWFKKLKIAVYNIRIYSKRYFIFRLIKTLLVIYFLLSVFFDQYDSYVKQWLKDLDSKWLPVERFDAFNAWLAKTNFIIITDNWGIKLLVLCLSLLLFPLGRNILFAVLKQSNVFFKLLPGTQTTKLFLRYINIARFAGYKHQYSVLSRLRMQYPLGTKLVILPMDMEFMGAGKPSRPYPIQMDMLSVIKKRYAKQVYPFVFVDPRRIERDGKTFFDYRIENNKVILEECFIRKYIEEKEFAGFKLYPALGYFPFDERLLPLWKYAADNGIPLMTHCIRGVIYYRGRKKPEWDRHPVFEQTLRGTDAPNLKDDPNPNNKPESKNDSNADEDFVPLLLPQMKPVDVQEIFTHPLNYACLYKKELLQKVVANAKDSRIKELFGYNEHDKTISQDLNELKLCFGHFGGEDEWKQFFEKDRTNYGHQVVQKPDHGIDFFKSRGEYRRGKLEQIWKTADWYSIICSLMLQHPNVYADISYILHGDLDVLPLLRHTLQNKKLRTRILYGTDFFVVRNHKSEKNMLADMQGGLLKKEFDLIARKNPVSYLRKGTMPAREIVLDICYGTLHEHWTKMLPVYKNMPGWLGEKGSAPYWFSFDDSGKVKMLSASEDAGHVCISGYMEEPDWKSWIALFIQLGSKELGYEIKEKIT